MKYNQAVAMAQSLAQLFFPLAQVSVVNSGFEQLHCENKLTEQSVFDLKPHQLSEVTLEKGRKAKALLLPLDDELYLSLLVDVSAFTSMHQLLNQFLDNTDKMVTSISWHQQVDEAIVDYCQQHQCVITALSNQNKRDLIHQLYAKGMFGYQDAANYIATCIGSSRATVYNYLKLAKQLKTIQLHQVDAFTDEPFSGNPAGIVIHDHELEEGIMKKIAKELNGSESAFIFPSDIADVKIRYFTPSGLEMKFCGHSTVGALFMLAYDKRLPMSQGLNPVKIETSNGIIDASVNIIGKDNISIQFATPDVDLNNSEFTAKYIAEVLGIDIETIDTDCIIGYERNNQAMYVKINTLSQLQRLALNQKSLRHFCEKNSVLAMCLFTDQTVDKVNDIHMRCFAPLVGVDEDPFTGSVLGGLLAYLKQYQLLPQPCDKISIEQGHSVARPGCVDIVLSRDDSNEQALVVAKARHFFSTEINL